MTDHNDRLPPGQHAVKGFPVMHDGAVPALDTADWSLKVFGDVEQERSWTWDEIQQLPRRQVQCDVHCVTRWSKLDTQWEGIPFKEILSLVKPLAGADYVMVHAESDYTTNVPLKNLLDDDILLADTYDGKPLTPEHGGPMRLLIPKLYFWKSAKWLRGFEFMSSNKPGYWESNGYNIHGDPWRESRYS